MDKETRDQLGSIIEAALTKALQPLVDDLRRLERYLYNDETTNTMGIVEQVREHERRIKELEQNRKIERKLWAIAWSLIGGVGIAAIELIKWYVSQPHK